MTRGGFLTRETAQRLGDTLRGLKARIGALEGRSFGSDGSVQRDDLYIAIPQAEITAATVTPTLITPTSGLCDVFHWSGMTLVQRGTKTVYNFRDEVVPAEVPVAIHREWTSGKFFALGCDCESQQEYEGNLLWNMGWNDFHGSWNPDGLNPPGENFVLGYLDGHPANKSIRWPYFRDFQVGFPPIAGLFGGGLVSSFRIRWDLPIPQEVTGNAVADRSARLWLVEPYDPNPFIDGVHQFYPVPAEVDLAADLETDFTEQYNYWKAIYLTDNLVGFWIAVEPLWNVDPPFGPALPFASQPPTTGGHFLKWAISQTLIISTWIKVH